MTYRDPLGKQPETRTTLSPVSAKEQEAKRSFRDRGKGDKPRRQSVPAGQTSGVGSGRSNNVKKDRRRKSGPTELQRITSPQPLQKAGKALLAQEREVAKQAEQLGRLTDIIKELSVKDDRAAKEPAAVSAWKTSPSSSESSLAVWTSTETLVPQSPGASSTQIYAFPTSSLSSSTAMPFGTSPFSLGTPNVSFPAVNQPYLAVDQLARDIVLLRGNVHSTVNLQRIVDGTTNQGLWISDHPVPDALTAIRSDDLLRLGAVRLDLLLYQFSSPLVLGLEVVTFVPQPADVAKELMAEEFGVAGASECKWGERPAILIVVPCGLRWWRQIMAAYRGKVGFEGQAVQKRNVGHQSNATD